MINYCLTNDKVTSIGESINMFSGNQGKWI